MKERPILFSGPMVRAILEGRKTQTRRVVNVSDHCRDCVEHGWTAERGYGYADFTPKREPYPFKDLETVRFPYEWLGNLWVRETFQIALDVTDDPGLQVFENCKTAPDGRKYIVYYRAMYDEDDNDIEGGWKPSIHMPRWASRLTLEMDDVSVERLQDVTEEGAKAEGVAPNWGKDLTGWSEQEHGYYDYSLPPFWDGEGAVHCTARESFKTLWDSLYGALNLVETHGWDANPWVWVISFKVTEGEVTP